MSPLGSFWRTLSGPFRYGAESTSGAIAPLVPSEVHTNPTITLSHSGITVRNVPPAYIAAANKQPAAPFIAPWPQVDKYPVLQGQNLSLQTLANAYRSATIGYR